MKTPTYLNDKSQVVILKQNEVINNSMFNIVGTTVTLTGTESVFFYIEDFKKKEITLDFLENTTLKLYMIFRSSEDAEYQVTLNVHDSANIDVFTALRNTDRLNVSIKRNVYVGNAYVNMANSIINMGHTNFHDYIYLEKENAEVNIDQLNIGSYKDEASVTQDVFHNAKATKSNIVNSLISNANSKLKYSVSGRIFKGNEFSICNQSNKGIILNEVGEIEVEPKLYIDEYNVEASHGAAIGQIDDEQLFYLLSRGLTEAEARSLIISGYTLPFIKNIDDEDIQSFVERQILKKINEVDVL